MSRKSAKRLPESKPPVPAVVQQPGCKLTICLEVDGAESMIAAISFASVDGAISLLRDSELVRELGCIWHIAYGSKE